MQGLRIGLLCSCLFIVTSKCVGDGLVFAFEGGVLPSDGGWDAFNPCKGFCLEWTEAGHFVIEWPVRGEIVNYNHWIARPPDPAPATLWAEWSFRSNHRIGPIFYAGDARFSIRYGGIHDVIYMYADAATSHGGIAAVRNLDPEVFHLYRFESPDGVNFRFSVDGRVFYSGHDDQPDPFNAIQFGGLGGLLNDNRPNLRNEWDFVRYGTIGYGERIVAAGVEGAVGAYAARTGEPGRVCCFLNPLRHADVDRFTVTFDSPNYVYVDEIAVEIVENLTPPPDGEGRSAPRVVATRRLDNGPPAVVEIVLDRPLPPYARTTLTFDDGAAINTVEFTMVDGDGDADGDFDLLDVAGFQHCFGCAAELDACPTDGPRHDCRIFDLTLDQAITAADFAALASRLAPAP